MGLYDPEVARSQARQVFSEQDLQVAAALADEQATADLRGAGSTEEALAYHPWVAGGYLAELATHQGVLLQAQAKQE